MSDQISNIKIIRPTSRSKFKSLKVRSGNGIIEGSRLNEGHVGIRFNDNCIRYPSLTVYLDGTDVTKHCNEAVPGDHGAVIMVNPDPLWGKARIFPYVLVFGLVTVERSFDPPGETV